MRPIVYRREEVRRAGRAAGDCPDCLLEYQAFVRRRPRVNERVGRRTTRGEAAESPRASSTLPSADEQRRIFEKERAAIMSGRGALDAEAPLLGLSFFREAEEPAFDFDFDADIPLEGFGSSVTESRLSRLWKGESRPQEPSTEFSAGARPQEPAAVGCASRRIDLSALFTSAAKTESGHGEPSDLESSSKGGESLRRVDVMELLGFVPSDQEAPRTDTDAGGDAADRIAFSFHERRDASNLLYGSAQSPSGAELSASARQALFRVMKRDKRAVIK